MLPPKPRPRPARDCRQHDEPGTYCGGHSRRMDDVERENSEKLAGLLQGREDWRREMQDGGELWYFGVASAGRLVITAEMDGFLVYRADEDRSRVIPGLSPWRSGSMSTRLSMRG
jgi:hypothetical protein